jgi:hypothetical protein
VRSLLAASAALLVGCFNPQIKNGGFACDTSNATPCPSGFSCVAGKCISATGGNANVLTVAKMGIYSGLRLDPMLTSPSDCPDAKLEPNDGPGAPPFGPPIGLAITPDQPTPNVQQMAICPKGNNPATGQHDVDWFQVPVTSPMTLVAQAFYDVAYGDLDLAIVDGTGNIVASDGTAVSNACASASLNPGTYYVVVVGAMNEDVNRYALNVRAYSTAASCMPGDMGPAHD